MKTTIHRLCLCLACLICASVFAADDKPVINWTSKDVAGADVKIPVDRPSVVAFVRSDQDQSKTALTQIQTAVTDTKLTQVIVILSGPLAAENAKQLSGDLPKTWSIVADVEFAASGKMGIHVWPTTLIVRADGTQTAHLAGLPKTFPTDLQANLDFAAGKITDAQLQQRLTTQDVITDSPAQAAARHLQVAQRLIEQGHPDQAEAEVALGLKLVPADPMLQLTMARVDVLLNKPKDAIAILDKLTPGATPGWQASLIRARALISLEKWADAKAILPDALKLNPDPAEAHYLYGLCYQHDQDWPHATEQFRLAFEKSPTGSKAILTPPAK